jgi:PIN domain nuclease of toxin-antitoxin system
LGADVPLIVLDTHAWIWSVVAPGKLTKDARAAIDRATELGISTITFWEIGLLHASGRLRLDRGARSWTRRAVAADPRITTLPVSTEIALAAGGLTAIRDPGDTIIYATALEHDAMLVTGDSRLRELDPARVVW